VFGLYITANHNAHIHINVSPPVVNQYVSIVKAIVSKASYNIVVYLAVKV